MSRRGCAVLVMTGAALLGPVGAAQAQEVVLPPDDPSISYQEVDPLPAESGCPQDPQICEGQVVDSLPLTGPVDRLLLTAAVGGGLVLAGVAGAVAGRRRSA
jgi:hypothetical protein